jgi:hypothetical protein
VLLLDFLFGPPEAGVVTSPQQSSQRHEADGILVLISVS